MDSLRFDVLTRALATRITRRQALQSVASAGLLGALPVVLVAPPAAAFKSFSGCKKRCRRFDGQCQSDCVKCCKKTVNGNQQRCDFGCGVIKGKKKKKK